MINNNKIRKYFEELFFSLLFEAHHDGFLTAGSTECCI